METRGSRWLPLRQTGNCEQVYNGVCLSCYTEGTKAGSRLISSDKEGKAPLLVRFQSLVFKQKKNLLCELNSSCQTQHDKICQQTLFSSYRAAPRSHSLHCISPAVFSWTLQWFLQPFHNLQEGDRRWRIRSKRPAGRGAAAGAGTSSPTKTKKIFMSSSTLSSDTCNYFIFGGGKEQEVKKGVCGSVHCGF